MRQRMDTLFGGSLPEAVRALASESGASQSQLEQAIRVLEEQHQEAEEYDLYDPMGDGKRKAPITGAFSLHSVRRYAKVKAKTATLAGDGFLCK